MPQERLPPAWRLLLRQFQNLLMLVLLGAIGVSIVLGQAIEALAIALIVVFSIGLGFFQEIRAQQAVQSLRSLAAPKAQVIRDGAAIVLAARELVPGDVLVLAAGDRVPADARLIEAFNMEVAEAVLTGESVPVAKDASRAIGAQAPLGDRENMVHAATLVTRGRAKALVTATGARTEVGRIGAMLAGIESNPTPLERQLSRLARWLVWSAGVVVLLIVGLGIARGHTWIEMLLFGVALAVAVVPEALPAVVTISLALGAQRMARRNAIVRRLPVVETLGSTTVICSDKTGTLTVGEMTATTLVLEGRRFALTGSGYSPEGSIEPAPGSPKEDVLRHVALACALCNDSHLVRKKARWDVQGDPTEGALIALAHKLGVEPSQARQAAPRRFEVAFTSERKRMTTVHEARHGPVAYSKGAPEVILAACSMILGSDGPRPLDAVEQAQTSSAALALAAQGMRVLAVSMRESPGPDVESDHVFLGLIGLLDPPRPEAKAAIATCHEAHIRPILITGDHPATAVAIAHELDILRGGHVLTGPEMEALRGEDMVEASRVTSVYARVSPANKLAIVEALQRQGHVVAMTGDGVNDAPALRKADIGIAMGLGGTDVAREASDMMLADDNFATIVAAVREGRAIFDNVRKYVVYLMSTNFGEVALIGGTMLLGLPLPLTAVQLLYVNLASDGLPALALAVDPQEGDIMQRPPRRLGSRMFERSTLLLMLLGGVWSALANMAVFAWALGSGRTLEEAMTMTFVSLVLLQFTKAYVFRSERRPIWQRTWNNRWLNRAVAWEITLILLILYVPALRRLFGVFPLTQVDWLVALAASISILPVMELAKWFIRTQAPPQAATA